MHLDFDLEWVIGRQSFYFSRVSGTIRLSWSMCLGLTGITPTAPLQLRGSIARAPRPITKLVDACTSTLLCGEQLRPKITTSTMKIYTYIPSDDRVSLFCLPCQETMTWPALWIYKKYRLWHRWLRANWTKERGKRVIRYFNVMYVILLDLKYAR